MFPWSYIVSTTSRSIIKSVYNPEPRDLPPFTNVDDFQGQLTVVQETGNPNGPTIPFPGITAASIALIVNAGSGAENAEAAIIGIDGNVITFSLQVPSPNDGQAVLQVILTIGEEQFVTLDIPVVIQSAVPLGGSSFLDGRLYRWPSPGGHIFGITFDDFGNIIPVQFS